MEDNENRWRSLAMLFSRDSELLLCPGVAPGHSGAPTGAPLFVASARPRTLVRPQPALPSLHDDVDDRIGREENVTGQPLFVIGAGRKIRLKNACAKDLLARGDLFLEQHGALTCRDGGSDRHLAMAIGTLGANVAGSVIVRERRAVWLRKRDGDGAVATLHLLRGDAIGELQRPTVLVTVFEPGEAPSIDTRMIAMAFRLTGAEARLAAMISGGKDTAHCAGALGVKTSTLRSHLSAIYRKTGARDKADLVRLVLSLCAI